MSEFMTSDLQKSGLTASDVQTRDLGESEREMCKVAAGIKGYVIPYFDIRGERVAFYRVKLDSQEVKYKQVKGSQNHLYFPKGFMSLLLKQKGRKQIIITEGEKKAALLVKSGIAAVGLTGVDSWRNRSIVLPGDVELAKITSGSKESIKAVMPEGESVSEEMVKQTAAGFEDLMDYILASDCQVFIVYDSDHLMGTKPQVQRAAAALGYELRFRGVALKHIKQVVLPTLGESSMSVDDFLLHKSGGFKLFKDLIQKATEDSRAFPRHPNVREFVGRKLQAARIGRKQLQELSLSIVTELDAEGYRMYSDGEGQAYYFHDKSAQLMKVDLNADRKLGIQDTAFGKYLYLRYGISPGADQRIMSWMGAQFAAEDPIQAVDPHRVFARPPTGEDCVRFQISDGQYVRIDKNAIVIKKNGDDGVLFEAGRTLPIDVEKFKKELEVQSKQPLTPWWDSVLGEARLKHRGVHQKLIALMYYVSPWLYRWRGAQMPVEIVIGESGSGKSTLCELRLAIQTGIPDLRNAPTDIKDWHAALSNSGGLHVTDNVQLLNKNLRTTLSDEICRLVTEPQPHVEMRKLYTNADIARIKVDNVFCFTAIAQPFMAADLLQRAIIVEFDKSQESHLAYESDWKERHLRAKGGREAWLAHHFIAIQRFFQAVNDHWDPNYRAKHRLINFEQSLVIMAKHVFGMESEWIPGKLEGDVADLVTANDQAMEGLRAFAHYWGRKSGGEEFAAKAVVEWAMASADYQDCVILINARKLGKYISNSKHMIQTNTGVQEAGKRGGKLHYKVSDRFLKEMLEQGLR